VVSSVINSLKRAPNLCLRSIRVYGMIMRLSAGYCLVERLTRIHSPDIGLAMVRVIQDRKELFHG
jgi:hypothetical protein